jgi:FkbM family methyltransferase
MDDKLIKEIESLNEQRKCNKISAFDYLDQIHPYNQILHMFSRQLGTNSTIRKIEIEKNTIIFTTKYGVKFFCKEVEKRGTLFLALNFENYEEEEFFIQKNLEDDNVIFDIGANIGWHSLHLANLHKNLRIFSFEPVEKTFQNFIENINLNNCSKIKAFNFGFSDTNGKYELFYHSQFSALSSLRKLFEIQTEKIKCNFLRLDDFIEKFSTERIDFIKCDVEGAELKVIQGGINTLKRFKPIIYLEIYHVWTEAFGHSPDELIRKIVDLGYKCFIYTNKTLVSIKNYLEGSEQGKYNFIFIHSENKRKFL